jgi:HSP20 family molecular chaperone IbpA
VVDTAYSVHILMMFPTTQPSGCQGLIQLCAKPTSIVGRGGRVPQEKDYQMLTLWNGFDRTLADEFRRVDRMFSTPVHRPALRPTIRAASWPRVNVTETEEAFEVLAEVPGFAPGDVSVSVHDGELKLEAKVKNDEESETENEGRKVLFSEHRRLEFTRTFKLNVPVNEAAVSAAMKDGLLTVTLPKAEAAKPKRIAIKGE